MSAIQIRDLQIDESYLNEMNEEEAAAYIGGGFFTNWLFGSHPYLGPIVSKLGVSLIGRIFG